VTSWLSALPHQIPFRAASTGRRIDDKTIEGTYLCTANDPLGLDVMLIEAMAQLAGGLAFGAGIQGFLTGIERCEVDRLIEPGDVVAMRVMIEAEFGGIFRFSGSGSIGGTEVVRGRFYLSSHA
jgi:3-hydroxymyristoyl/3-hydroxydecanoyl-(acyl carrier protein) dehydratase